MAKQYYTASEVDDILEYSKGVTRQMIHKGLMRATKMGRDWIVYYTEVEKHLKRRIKEGKIESKELPR